MSEDDDRGAVSVTLTRWGGGTATVGRKYFYIIVFIFSIHFLFALQLLNSCFIRPLQRGKGDGGGGGGPRMD